MRRVATRIDELDDGIFRLATLLPGTGRTVNQFLIDADEPLLFHAGLRATFPGVIAALARVMPLERLAWLSFSHVEADEMGAMNQWLARVPGLRVLHTPYGVASSIADLADRPPVELDDGEALELGGRRVRLIPTPEVPHNPEAAMLFEEVTGVLCCSDLGSNDVTHTVVVDELVLAVEAETAPFPALTSLTAQTPAVLRRLAALAATTLAVMHGASYRGDVAALLHAFADDCEGALHGASRAEMRHLADVPPAATPHRVPET